jgi:Mg-chelatase subunit ChlD
MATPPRDRDDLRLPPRHGRDAVMVLPAELDMGRRPALPASIVFALDAAGPEGAARADAVRGAVAALLGEPGAGTRAGVVLLGERTGEVVAPPTGSAERARRQLAALPVGGRASLAPGLRAALLLAAEEATRSDGPVPLLVLVSDGAALKATPDALAPAARVAALGLPALVVDTSERRAGAVLARVAEVMGARLLRAPGATAELLAAVAGTMSALAGREPRWRPPRVRRPGRAGR